MGIKKITEYPILLTLGKKKKAQKSFKSRIENEIFRFESAQENLNLDCTQLQSKLTTIVSI